MSRTNWPALITGIAIGAGVGAALGILFAPQSGEDTRRDITRAAQKGLRVVKDRVDDVSDRVGDVRDHVSDLKDQVTDVLERGKDLVSQLQDTAEEVKRQIGNLSEASQRVYHAAKGA